MYSKELLHAYSRNNSTGESIWLDFTVDFRPYTITVCTRAMTVYYFMSLLKPLGVHVEEVGDI